MRTELPTDLLHRRLGRRAPTGTADTEPADDDADGSDDPNSLLPQWLPDSAADGWLTRVRADPGRAGAIALAVIAAIAVLISVFTVLHDRPAPVMSAKLPPVEMVASTIPSPGAGPSADAGQPVVVSVVGLVHKPGLASLAAGARIADALTAAGGALEGADTAGLNLARPLVDGEQIVVGLGAPAGQPTVLGSSVGAGPAAPDAPAAPRTTAAAPKAGGVVNLNTATVEQLDALPGVGPVTAAAIVAWRDTHGKFASVDQLGEVDGIGPTRLEKLRALVRV